MPGPRVPISTYRLQFNRHCTFADAAAVIPYLADLGISDCYTSPYLQARPGSLHGYDIVDPTTLNAELGSAADYQTFVDALTAHRMGQILDIVPNHMHISGPWNPWWQDVLEHGQGSRYAHFFDIDWDPMERELKGKVFLPILGDPYEQALENGELTLCYHDGRFFIRYGDHRLPIDPSDYGLILSHCVNMLRERHDAEAPPVQELQRIIAAFMALPGRNDPDPERLAVRYREQDTLKRALAALTDEHPTMMAFVQDMLRVVNGAEGDAQRFNRLDALLQRQVYRLACWREAGDVMNYRRFFDVHELAALRVEEPDVFRHVHQAVFSLIPSAEVHGLRVDHVDGLYDPKRYLERWQEWAKREAGRPADSTGRSLFIIVEKILGNDERLPEDWPVHGTTGYDFLYLINNLFVDARHERAMDDCYRQFANATTPFDTLAYECKHLIMETSMSSELKSLGYQLSRVSETQRHARDVTLDSLTHALREIIACLPVYRTYVSPRGYEDVGERDRDCLRLAVRHAQRRNPTTGSHVFEYLLDCLLGTRTGRSTCSWEAVQPFVMKFQQTTGSVMAKGLEDTALYRDARLLSLNEVGGAPAQFGISVAAFHARMRERQQRWPLSLSATSTHDTKRSEDVRARLNVLSELPQEWSTHVGRWHRLNTRHKRHVDGREVPSRNEEYLLYQTLLGAWPLAGLDSPAYREFRQRIQAYMRKALKEARVQTSWTDPHEAYEQAVHEFIQAVLDPASSNGFLEAFLPFQQTIARYGMYNALSQLVLKICCPGIPDLYQGSEVWDLALVDPDNRRPVDYERLHRLSTTIPSDWSEITESFLRDLLESWEDGRIKLYVTRTGLNYRRAHPELFLQGTYDPLETDGTQRHALCAFQRTWHSQAVVVVVPRLIHGLIPDPAVPALGRAVWGETGVILPDGDRATAYRNVLTNQRVLTQTREAGTILAVADLFQQLPLAIMERVS